MLCIPEIKVYSSLKHYSIETGQSSAIVAEVPVTNDKGTDCYFTPNTQKLKRMLFSILQDINLTLEDIL